MIKWSFSSLKQYLNCPRQYNEVKVLQNFQTKVSHQMAYGTEVHKSLEEYTRDKKQLPPHHKQFKSMVDVLMEIPGDKYIEYKMALTPDKEPCEFDSPDYWVRGIADLVIVDDDTAFVIDYKTGSSKYADPKQLKLMALMMFKYFPKVQLVRGGLLFVVKTSFLPDDYERNQQDKYWMDFTPDLLRLASSFEHNSWPPQTSPLCRYCPVLTCEFQR